MAANTSTANKTTNKSLNESSWFQCPNEERFINSLIQFINESWETVSQIKENCVCECDAVDFSTTISNVTQSMNQSCWFQNPVEEKFLVALANLMNQSYLFASQLRGKYGLSLSYQMDPIKAQQKILELSQRIEEKKQEVSALTNQKSELESKLQQNVNTSFPTHTSQFNTQIEENNYSGYHTETSYVSSGGSGYEDGEDYLCQCDE